MPPTRHLSGRLDQITERRPQYGDCHPVLDDVQPLEKCLVHQAALLWCHRLVEPLGVLQQSHGIIDQRHGTRQPGVCLVELLPKLLLLNRDFPEPHPDLGGCDLAIGGQVEQVLLLLLQPGQLGLELLPGQLRGFRFFLQRSTHVLAQILRQVRREPQRGVVVNDRRFDGVTLDVAGGGVFSFGDTSFEGSLPGLGLTVSNIAGIVPTNNDQGYFLVGKDGGVFAFGNAPFLGSLPGLGVHVSNIIGIAATPDDQGYWLVGADGAVYAFGDAGYYGNALGSSSPVVTGRTAGLE